MENIYTQHDQSMHVHTTHIQQQQYIPNIPTARPDNIYINTFEYNCARMYRINCTLISTFTHSTINIATSTSPSNTKTSSISSPDACMYGNDRNEKHLARRRQLQLSWRQRPLPHLTEDHLNLCFGLTKKANASCDMNTKRNPHFCSFVQALDTTTAAK